ncbi:MAG: heme A synthase [Thermoplasmatota archaeon]|nr:COX15/CtaA family protein [Halobacteriales archaeon]
MARIVWARRLGVTCVALTFLLMVLGAWVKANGAGLSCPDWPACYGKMLPPFPSSENGGVWQGHAVGFTQGQELYEWTHRAVVAVILVPVAAFAAVTATARGFRRSLRALPAAAVGIYFLQAGLGAITVVTGNPPWATTLHLATAVAWFGTLLAATCIAFLAPERRPTPVAPVTSAPHRAFAPAGGVRFVYPGEDVDEERDAGGA